MAQSLQCSATAAQSCQLDLRRDIGVWTGGNGGQPQAVVFLMQIQWSLRVEKLLDQAFVPPSTVRFAPVMYAASGLATNATRAATSSTRP